MSRFGSPLNRRTLEATRVAAVVWALAASSVTSAQTTNAPGQPSKEASSQSAPADSTTPAVSATRGLFLGLIVQGVGAEIGSTLWKGLRGSITKWFSHDADADRADSLMHGGGGVTTTGETTPLHAGIAYEAIRKC